MNHSCTPALVSFSNFYKENVHWYLSSAIIIFGSVFNIINIIVFTRKSMVSPTNVVLTWLAVADLALLLSYSLRLLYDGDMSSLIRVYQPFHLARFVSLWMTLVLAVWRYLAVVRPWKARNWCNMKTTYRTVVAVYVLCSLGTFVNYITQEEFLLQVPKAFRTFTDSIYIWGFYVIPAFILPVLSIGLVYELWKATKRHQKLMPSTVQQNKRDSDTENRTNHITRMLLVVLFLFLIWTLPYAIHGLTAGNLIKKANFRPDDNCFLKLLRFYEMLALLDAASNFLVYFFMSGNFRKTCHTLFNCNAFAAVKTMARSESIVETTPD